MPLEEKKLKNHRKKEEKENPTHFTSLFSLFHLPIQ